MKYRFVAVLFFASLVFFFVQHSSGLSWDFSAYVLNARYYLFSNSYFEPFRPPLASWVLIPLFLNEYAFIVFVSVLYLYSCVLVCRRYRLDLNVFYAVSLSSFMLGFSFFAGTELLSLSLIQLVFVFIDSSYSGLFLGLAMLARYTNVAYSVLVLFFSKHRLKALFIALLVLSPWLFFNWFNFGSPVYSWLDQYANNIAFRWYAWRMPSLIDFLPFLGYYAVLLPVCLFLYYRKARHVSRSDLLFIFALIFEFYSFVRIPLRSVRYLFIAVLPVSYFISKVLRNPKFAYFIAVLNFVLILLFANVAMLSAVSPYRIASAYSNCMISSNAWVYIDYLGFNSMPFPGIASINSSISEGYRIILYKYIPDPLYVLNSSFIHEFSVLNETDSYYVLGNASACLRPYGFNMSYLDLYNYNLNKTYGYTVSYSLIDALTGKKV